VARQPDAPHIDPRWDVAMELLLDGRSHKAVAAAVGCHRNTITNWWKDPAFRVELARRSDERISAAKQRLAIVTTRLVDRLGRLANKAMDAAERDPTDHRAQRAARDWLRNYRKLAEAEAQILGSVVHPACSRSCELAAAARLLGELPKSDAGRLRDAHQGLGSVRRTSK
jgi:hypothetical protein